MPATSSLDASLSMLLALLLVASEAELLLTLTGILLPASEKSEQRLDARETAEEEGALFGHASDRELEGETRDI